MAVWQFTMGFRQLGKTPTETYYHEASNIVAAGVLMSQLCAKRNAMLFDTTEWVGCRMGLAPPPGAVAGPKRQAQLYTPGPYVLEADGFTGTVPSRGVLVTTAPNKQVDQPNSCIQIVIRYNDTRSTKRYLSMVPDECIRGSPDSVRIGANGGFSDGYTEFQRFLTREGWMIRARSITGDFGEKDVQDWIASASDPHPMGAVLVLTDAPALAAGQKVAIKGTRRRNKAQPSYNMIYRVKAVIDSASANTRTVILGQSQGGDPASIKVLGTLQKVGYQYYPIQQWSWFRAGTHKRGVSFGASHGRRSARMLLDP